MYFIVLKLIGCQFETLKIKDEISNLLYFKIASVVIDSFAVFFVLPKKRTAILPAMAVRHCRLFHT